LIDTAHDMNLLAAATYSASTSACDVFHNVSELAFYVCNMSAKFKPALSAAPRDGERHLLSWRLSDCLSLTLVIRA